MDRWRELDMSTILVSLQPDLALLGLDLLALAWWLVFSVMGLG